MKHIFCKLILLFILFQGSNNTALSQFRPLAKKKHSVNKVLEKVLAAEDFKTAGFGFLAMDLESGELISSYRPDLALRPASTLKLLSTATALEVLGPGHRFSTKLLYTREGNLLIRGGGDPTLGSIYFDTIQSKEFLHEWVEAVRETGIDSLTGRIIADARYFGEDMLPPSWSWQNMGQYYGAPASGLSIYDNIYTLVFHTGDSAGAACSLTDIVPDIPLEVENTLEADTISWDNSYIYGAPYSNKRVIRGTLPMGRKLFGVKGSMPDPPYVAALQLDSALRSEGIVIAGTPTTLRLHPQQEDTAAEEKLLWEEFSPELTNIIRECNTHSVNLYAEHFLLHAGMQLGAEGLTLSSADSVLAFWEQKGMDTRGLAMHDGSGLSQYNAITPRQMVWLLSYMKQQSSWFEDYYASMAVAGETGTLESLFKGSVAEGKLRAKSGTISRVKAYAGYVESASGRKIAFSMSVNGFSGSSRQARAKLEQLMISLAEFDK